MSGKKKQKLGIAPSMAAAAAVCAMNVSVLKAAKGAGCVAFAGSGRVDCDELLRWLVKHPEVLEQAGESVNLHFETAMKTRADRLLREHRLAVLRKEFVSSAEMEIDVSKMIAAAKAVLLSGPASIAPQVIGVSVQEAETLIKLWLHNALSKLEKNPLGKTEAKKNG